VTPLLGQHLLLDGTIAFMPNAGELHDILLDLAQVLAVTVVAVEAHRWGDVLTGMMVIAESHVAMHLRERPAESYIDVFSCKRFDDWRVVNFVEVQLGFVTLRMQCLDRGQP